MSHVAELARPFPDKYVKKNPSGGGSYVPHGIIKQRAILVLGTPPTFELVQVIRGDVPELAPNPQGNSKRAKEGASAIPNAVVGVVGRLTALIDGHSVTVEDAGDCEDPYNWPHDGARLKDAMSDAYKRCAANLGLGLHLWQKDQADYFLFERLTENDSGGAE